MSDDYQFNSRMSRQRKRKNNKKTTFYIVLLSVIFISLLITFFFIITSNSNDDEDKVGNDNHHNHSENNETIGNNDNDNNENKENLVNDSNGGEENNISDKGRNDTNSTNNSDIENDTIDDVEVVDDSDDDNVIRTYIGQWEPIGTVQTGEHVTNFNDGSLDRIEIEKASSQVTGIPVDEMYTGWVGNDGQQKVFTVVSNQEREEYYKLYLSWIDEEGWQVTKVEKIKEFNSDEYRK